MYAHLISIVTAIILLSNIAIGKDFERAVPQAQRGIKVETTGVKTIWSKLKGGTSCAGAHHIKECSLLGILCKTFKCEAEQYCIGPQEVPPASATLLKSAQCVEPDYVGEASCADSESQKIEILFKGIAVPVIEKCPPDKSVCLFGKCLAENESLCGDGDNSVYANLSKWEQSGGAEGHLDGSITKAGGVKIGFADGGSNEKVYKDECKTGTQILLEETCYNGAEKEVSINCASPKLLGTCKYNAQNKGYCDLDYSKLPDADLDSAPDIIDNCPNTPNPEQEDADKNSVGDLCQVISLSNGWGFTCGIMFDKTVKCWGSKETSFPFGLKVALTPEPVEGLKGVIQLDSAQSHTCALLEDMTVKCWGSNGSGELGNGTKTDNSAPVKVTGLIGAIKVAAGNSFSCTLLFDKTIKCWGDDISKFGSNMALLLEPTEIFDSNGKKIDGAVDIAAGGFHACAVLEDGTATCWGVGIFGQLGI